MAIFSMASCRSISSSGRGPRLIGPTIERRSRGSTNAVHPPIRAGPSEPSWVITPRASFYGTDGGERGPPAADSACRRRRAAAGACHGDHLVGIRGAADPSGDLELLRAGWSARSLSRISDGRRLPNSAEEYRHPGARRDGCESRHRLCARADAHPARGGLARRHFRLRRAAAMDQCAGADILLDVDSGEQRPSQPLPRGARDRRPAVASPLRLSGRGDRDGACPASLFGIADLRSPIAHRPRLAARERRPRRFACDDIQARAAAAFGARAGDRGDLHLPPFARLLRNAGPAGRSVRHDDLDADRFLRRGTSRLAARSGRFYDAARHGARGHRPRRALRAGRRIIGGQVTPAGAWTKAFAALLAAAIVIPVLAVAPLAFSKQSFLQLPPHDWSLRWWEAFFADASWFRALMTSFEVATLSCLLSVAAGTSAALGLPRLGPRMRTIASGLFLGPLVAPVIVLAVGLYALARSFGLVGSTLGLVLAHTMLALPYVVLNVGVSVAALDPRLALAASGLGAGPWRTFRTVTLPSILPGIVGGGVFAFVTSFDEVVLAVFLAGPNVKTLPVRIWEDVRVEYTPVVAVAATIMIVLAVIGSAVGRLATRGTA